MDYKQIFRFFFDAAMMYWFFIPLSDKKDVSQFHKRVSWLALPCLLPLYLVSGGADFFSFLGRCILRILVYIIWIRLYKATTLRQSIYFGLLCWITFTCENNIFLTPQMSIIRWNQISYVDSATVNLLINYSFEYVLEALLILVVSRSIPMDRIEHVDHTRLGLASALVACELYVKYTLKVMSTLPSGSYPSELTIYPILMQLLMMVALIMFERYLHNRRLREEARLNETINRYRYENALTQAQAEEDLRRVHHDLKNHLIVLSNLLNDNQKASSYIDNLLHSVSSYERVVETGNKILNGLIGEKMQLAALHEIDINACFDFSVGAFIDDMDICAIFGNAIDNAIEASCKVSETDKRSILIKSSVSSNHLVITFMNYYEGELQKRNGLPVSTKTGRMHGIGLNSIARSVKKYGGTMVSSTDEYHNFILTIVIPIPE